MQPRVILNVSMSLDGRVDEDAAVLFNTLDDYRIQLMRRDIDAIITTSAYINSVNPAFPCADPDKRLRIIIIDKGAETNPKSVVIANECYDVILATTRGASPSRLSTLQKAKPKMEVRHSGVGAVNLETLLWELHRQGVKTILLEADYQTNVRMLDYRLVDELYVLISPVILGSKKDVFEGKVDNKVNLVLDGISQYGNAILLHYDVKKV